MGDGTIMPSFFGTTQRGGVRAGDSFNSIALYLGEVTQIIYPEDDLSLSKKYVEYVVSVILREGSSTASTTLFNGCIVGQLFGGFADQMNYTLRKDAGAQNKTGGPGIGSKVLLMCVNGVRANPVIIGGLPDSRFKDKDKHSKTDGHNLFFEFNGTQFTINKDGELKLTFRGATNTDGTLTKDAVKEAEGSYIQINKEGDIKIATPKDDQFVHINHKDKKIEMQAQSEWDVTIKGTVNITADQHVNIKSIGVNVGDATDHWMLGDTYRSAETKLNAQLSTGNATLMALMTTAGASLTAGTILNAIPIVGGALAATPFSIAASALLSASPVFAQMQTAQTAFEAQAVTYLSKKNLSD